MKTKIQNLLSAKTIEREELNRTWEVTSVQSFSDKMDKIETEIDLLLELLKE